MNKPHRHAEVIKAWADGAEIQVFQHAVGWVTCSYRVPLWCDHNEYRVKPAREFPKSTLSYDDLCNIVNSSKKSYDQGHTESFYTYLSRIVADEAVKQYILDMEKE